MKGFKEPIQQSIGTSSWPPTSAGLEKVQTSLHPVFHPNSGCPSFHLLNAHSPLPRKRRLEWGAERCAIFTKRHLLSSLWVPGTKEERTEVLDKVPALKELLDDQGKGKGGGEKLVSITGLSPFFGGLRSGRAQKGTTWMSVQDIYAQATHVQDTCAEPTQLQNPGTGHEKCMCRTWAGFTCRVHMCIGHMGVTQELHLPKPGWLGRGRAPSPSQLGSSGLRLVLALCGCEEVLQHTAQVVKGGPVLRELLPAQHHKLVQLIWTVVRSYHAVALLQVLNHLRIGHP